MAGHGTNDGRHRKHMQSTNCQTYNGEGVWIREVRDFVERLGFRSVGVANAKRRMVAAWGRKSSCYAAGLK